MFGDSRFTADFRVNRQLALFGGCLKWQMGDAVLTEVGGFGDVTVVLFR